MNNEALENTKKSHVKKASKNKAAATQNHLRIAEVRDDTAILKSGAVRAVIETTAMNFNLKSEVEQDSIIASYQSFLNTLSFPLQIVVQSKRLDLDNYINKLRALHEKQENALLKKQTADYIDFIERLLDYVDIMDKKFYVVVPYEKLSVKPEGFFTKLLQRLHLKETKSDYVVRLNQLKELQKELTSRVESVVNGLKGCGLKAKRLNTKELIALYYHAYNPDLAFTQSPDKFADNMSA